MAWSSFAGRLIHRGVATPPGTWLVNRALVERQVRALRHSLAHPLDSQAAILADLLPHAAATHFGRDHSLHAHTTQADYTRRVPVRRYEALKPYVDRMLAGEPDVLWPGRVTWFSESSGTSGPKKQIPMTRASHRLVYQATATAYACQLAARLDLARFLAGRSVFFAGSYRRLPQPRGFLAGDITALSVYLTPWYLDWARAPAKSTAVIPNCNWEERLRRMAHATLAENVVHLAGLPTWLLHFGRMALDTTGAESLAELWPNLVAVTTGGVSPAPYRDDLQRVIVGEASRPLLVSEVYNGTEGFYAAQVDDGPMALLPDGGIFYEFVPRAEAIAGRFDAAAPLEGVVTGVDYAPIVTGYNGLWRYLIGDVVRFVDTRPYRLEVRGRLNQYLSIAGEELLVDVTDRALAQACREIGATLTDYTVAALKLHDAPDNACHLWLVELRDAAPTGAPALASALDRVLFGEHYDYAKMRTPGAWSQSGLGLGPPLVLLLPPGSFRRWLAARLHGATGGQSKAPRLTHDSAPACELLGIAGRAAIVPQVAGYPAHYSDALRQLLPVA